MKYINKKRIKDSLLVAALWGTDIFYVRSYSGQYDTFFNGYAHDILLPAGGYFYAKSINMFRGNTCMIAMYNFLGCSAFEVAQHFGLYHGTYDPKDFLAYAAGVGLALGIDLLTTGSKKDKSENLEDKLAETNSLS